jgi:hypothetical protein
MQVGRNDPCPCGSGKKYKRCCMARDKAAQAERVAWERAVGDMRRALIGFAKEPDLSKDVAAGLGLFWQDRYTADTAHRMSVDESLRFFDWFAHDYTLRASEQWPGKRLVEVYRAEMAGALSDQEAAILDLWLDSLPGSAFVLEQADPAQGTVVLRDLWLDRTLTIHDQAAASHGEVGQILLARPLPEHGRTGLAGATVVLPAAEKEGLCSFVEQAYRAYCEENADSPSADAPPSADASAEAGDRAPVSARFLRERAYLLTHYALEWADREGRPAVAAADPDAPAEDRPVAKKLIRWSQERVRSR